MPRLLTTEEIESALGELPGWSGEGSSTPPRALSRTVELASFRAAVQLIVEVADEAETMDHHPDIDLRWRTVRVVLSTHSAGGITQLDIELAHRIQAAAPAPAPAAPP